MTHKEIFNQACGAAWMEHLQSNDPTLKEFWRDLTARLDGAIQRIDNPKCAIPASSDKLNSDTIRLKR